MRELQTMKELASYHPHTVQLLDNFDLKGPNGSHKCLVYELLGPNVPDTIDTRFPDGRLPGKLAKVIAKQCLIGLDGLHQRTIGHGGKSLFLEMLYMVWHLPSIDLHTRNLAFTMPYIDDLSEERFIRMLGKPDIGYVQKRENCDRKCLEPGIPEYIVRPASRQTLWNPAQTVKILDFGESFLHTTISKTLHTPLSLRAPEVIFRDRIDHRVDLWSMGCMVGESTCNPYKPKTDMLAAL